MKSVKKNNLIRNLEIKNIKNIKLIRILTFYNISKFLQLNCGAQREYLTIEFLWATRILVMAIRPFYLVDEFICLFLV